MNRIVSGTTCACGRGKDHDQCGLQSAGEQPVYSYPTTEEIARAVQTAIGHFHAGRLAEAEAICKQIQQADPDCPDSWHLLGLIAYQTKMYDVAVELIGRAIELMPDFVEAHNNLGNALKAQGKLDQSVASYQKAISLKPGFAEAHNNLAHALKAQGKLGDAVASCRQALLVKPDYADAYFTLGDVLLAQGRVDEAIYWLRQALFFKPEFFAAYNLLGNALQLQGRLDDAISTYRQALMVKPDYPEAYYNMAAAFHALGRLEDAVANYRQALRIKPDYAVAYSNLIFTLDMTVGADTPMLQAERKRWSDACLASRYDYSPFPNNLDPGRRLRIGYVSADFKVHSAAFVFGAMLVKFDSSAFDVYAYSNSAKEDSLTQRFRQSVTCWRNIAGLPDEVVADLIRQDKIDILVDLSGHSADNRLLVFARKPAPIQITAWGYIGGTGMKAMDVFLADPVVVPPEEKQYYTEDIRYLPNAVGAFFPETFPAVNPLPALSATGVTFGSFNRLVKVSDDAFKAWAQVLLSIPSSRMVLKTKELDDASTRARVLEHFTREGVDPGRITMLGATSWLDHMSAFNQVDISLDPFPHGGGVTTLEGLMMGIPVITLRWHTLVGRISASILTTLGLTDWIAETPEQYIELAIQKAHDLVALARLRGQMRDIFTGSVIGNPQAYAQAVEKEYRQLWQEYISRNINPALSSCSANYQTAHSKKVEPYAIAPPHVAGYVELHRPLSDT